MANPAPKIGSAQSRGHKTASEVIESPDFKALVRKRWTVSFVLLALLFVGYYGYILLVASNKELMARPSRPTPGAVTTLGHPARHRGDRLRLGASSPSTSAGPTRPTTPRSSGSRTSSSASRSPSPRPSRSHPHASRHQAAAADGMTSSLGTPDLRRPSASSSSSWPVTLVITYWAARKTKTSSEFYAAGRSVSALQNGLALAGDYMSAASFLGIAGLVALKGYDGMIYATGWLVGWPALMFLIAEPLRNLGKFTFADVVAFRLRQKPVRIAAAIGGILTVLFYTIAQMVGSGAPHQAHVRHALRARRDHRRRGHAGLRALRRHARHHLGADHQGRPAPLRRHGAHHPGAGPVRLQPGQPLRGGRRAQVRPGGARAGRARHQARSTPSRSAWRSCSACSACRTS